MDDILKTGVGGLALDNPFIAASGTAGFIHDAPRMMRLELFAAAVTKTITSQPREGNPQPRVWETPSGVVNSVGIENPGVERFVSEHLPNLRITERLKVIVSVGGKGVEELASVLRHLALHRNSFDSVELNLSCPNIRGRMLAQSAKRTAEAVASAKELLPRTPLFVKLTPAVTDVVKVAAAALDAGADALVLTNTHPALTIDPESLKPALGNIYGGLSGPAVKPLTLRAVYAVYGKLRCPIVASGGITNAQDTLEALAAGASAVQIGTASLTNPGIIEVTLADLKALLSARGIHSVKEVIGLAHRNDRDA